MKKDTFIKGAMISTLCIIISKILGIIYVIPFHAIIGENGRSLYGYAYNMYTLFLNFSTVGIPLAISKIVSEYHSLGYEDAKRRCYRLAIKITLIMSIVSTIILIVAAPFIANIIIGGVEGGNSVTDVVFVLRVAASAILFVTMLSSLRGYLQGHKYISPSAISQVIEQFVRVVVIIVGSYLAVKLWGTKEAVGIAVFGATAGSIAALIYLSLKMKKEGIDKEKVALKKEEKKLTNKVIVKQLITYTVPFIIVSIATSLYNTVDILTIVKPLIKYAAISATDAETVLSIISTWGAKLNVIVTSVSAGMVISVLPNIASDFVKKDIKSVNNKINKSLQIVIYFVLPMVVGLSFLAEPVWTAFYGNSSLGASVFKFSIFTAMFYALFLNMHTVIQSIDNHLIANVSIIAGLVTKVVLNIPLIILFSKIPFIKTYYGSITATIIAYIVPLIIIYFSLKKDLKTDFSDTFKKSLICLAAVIVMVLVMSLIKVVLPFSDGRITAVFYIAGYSIVGAVIYFFITSKTGVFKDIFGTDVLTFIKSKVRR